MARRKRLQTPTEADLAAIEADLQAGPLPDIAGSAPIAQVAADAAFRAEPEAAEDRIERVQDKADAATLREAQSDGRLITRIPLDAIEPDQITRDRTQLVEDELTELKASIMRGGLRLPIEVFEIPNGKPDKPWGLLSGYRRYLAFKELVEMGEERFSDIPALIRTPESVGDAYTAMVEENEVRSGLSTFERGRIAVVANMRGAFDSVEAAVDTLFATGSRAKRSKIRSYALIFEELGDVLRFPTRLSEAQAIRLANAVRAGLTEALRAALVETYHEDAAAEWASLEPVIAGAEGARRNVQRGGRPKRAPARGEEVTLGKDLSVKSGRDDEGFFIRLEGKRANPELVDDIMRTIERLYGVKNP